MALTKCPDCGKELSDKAANCPKCNRPMSLLAGTPFQVQRKGGKFELVGAVLICLSIVGCVAHTGGSSAGYWILSGIGFVVFLAGRFM
jgi:predicted amidophosphoribosyltransferase